MSSLSAYGEDALDRGLLPDFVVRRAIRYLCNQRLAEIARGSIEDAVESKWSYIQGLKAREEIAIETEKANEQHYEVSRPPARGWLWLCSGGAEASSGRFCCRIARQSHLQLSRGPEVAGSSCQRPSLEQRSASC
mgnify:CR=1 FL=1